MRHRWAFVPLHGLVKAGHKLGLLIALNRTKVTFLCHHVV